MKRQLAFCTMALLALALGLLSTIAPASALDREGLQRGLRASVKLLILDPDEYILGTCSGTVLNSQGYILTNYHCVGQTDIYGEDPNYAHGDLFHPQGILAVAINEDPRQLPVLTYYAQFLAGNPDQDVAVLKIIDYLDSSQPLPEDLPLVPAVLLDSDLVEIGEEVSIIGFPGLGGETVTFTEGSISGFEDDDGDRVPDWFKTSALINAGNSGGTAVNERGEMIGIPSRSVSGGADRPQDALYHIKPLNHAIPVIQRAMQAGNSDTEIGGNQGPNVGGDVPTGENIGELTFGTGYGQNGLTGMGTSFPSGTTEVHGAMPYQNMRNGTPWGYIWQYEGQDAVISDPDLRWEEGTSGELDLAIFSDGAMPDGDFNLQIFINDELVREGQFTIGNSEPIQDDVPQSPPTQESEGVTVFGQIVDMDTSQPIEGAIILFLLPGATVRDFANSEDVMSLVQAMGSTDAEGFYVLVPPVPRGEAYTVIVIADGYETLAVDDGIEMTADEPDLLELQTIGLERE